MADQNSPVDSMTNSNGGAVQADVVDADQIIINGVRDQPHLYMADRPDYRDVAKRDNAFSAIGKTLQMTGGEVSRRWKSLRDRFTRERRTRIDRQRNGSHATITSKWRYYDSMAFLVDHLRARSSSLNLLESSDQLGLNMECESMTEPDASSSPETQECITSIASVLYEDSVGSSVDNRLVASVTTSSNLDSKPEVLHTASTSNSGDLGPPPKSRRDNGSADLASAMRFVGNALSSRNVPQLASLDAEDAFGCNLAMRLKRLPPQKSALAQMRIQELLYNIEFDE